MAMLRTGTIVRLWRAFGRVRFTVRWDGGETMAVTVPTRQIDATLRAGDRVGTIEPGEQNGAADIMDSISTRAMPDGEEKMLREQAMIHQIVRRWEGRGKPEADLPWEKRYYQRG
ncbi:MAG: hypothetical protein M3176_13660 [Chloroflexota bacterium]|nr:hypothetical protein [Chloroflexota bacterium]